MLAAAAGLTEDDGLRKLTAEVLGPQSSPRIKKSRGKTARRAATARPVTGTEPQAGIGSDHSQVSILRCDWRRGSPLLVVKHDVPGAPGRVRDADVGDAVRVRTGERGEAAIQ